ncbi:MAG: UbiA family prenyltransferase [Bacteroidia bacterium]
MQKVKSNKSYLFDRDTLLHLRLPFSFFLLPIFCFALSQASGINVFNTLLVFISLHFFIYPGSNIYNSYMDRDTGSIGGLKNPPPVTRKLYTVSMIFDLAGLLLCAFINWQMILIMLVYIGVSKAYSWHKIRLKKFAFVGWLVVMLFQGGYTFLIVNMAVVNKFSSSWFNEKNIFCMVLASFLIGGFYPLTQIYQHREDSGRGDYTISYRLGIIGTFIFTAVMFVVACIIAWIYFTTFYSIAEFVIFILCLLPVTGYFLYWLGKTLHNRAAANFDNTMRMTFISSVCMIICWSILFFVNHG